MPSVIHIGHLEVAALDDGTIRLPPMYYPGLDVAAHPDLLHADGTIHIPARCFLVRDVGGVVLVDAGLGPSRIPFPADVARQAGLTDPPEFIAEGGRLPEALAAVGVEPGDIDRVVLTHLHADHIGWVAPAGEIYFSAAEVVYGDAEEPPPAAPAPGELEGRRNLELAKRAGRVRTIDAPDVEIMPGVVAHHTPGHTPGHYVVSVSSNGEQAYLLGDVVHHPLQLTNPGISFISETTPELALRVRDALFDRFTDHGVVVGATHVAGTPFRRIVAEHGRRRWITHSSY